MFQISQVGGVLESSGPPLEDGHRDFEDWCILGWGIHENKWANSNDAKCIYVVSWFGMQGWNSNGQTAQL